MILVFLTIVGSQKAFCMMNSDGVESVQTIQRKLTLIERQINQLVASKAGYYSQLHGPRRKRNMRARRDIMDRKRKSESMLIELQKEYLALKNRLWELGS